MTYHQDLGDDNAPVWCSGNNPKTGCANIANVCVPLDPSTLDLFRLIQRTANALLAASGKKLLDVDGRIGPATLQAVNELMPEGVGFTSCDAVALSGGQVAAQLMSVKQADNIADVGDPPPRSPPTVVANGSVVNPPASVIAASAAAQGGLVAMLTSPAGLIALGVGGLLLYKATRRGRKR